MLNRFANVRLELDSRPESVALVRAAVSGIAESRGVDPELANDLRTAVSEACNNVVVHAYPGVAGPLAVEVEADGAGLLITVRDRGVGFRAVAAHADGMGVGLAVISALAARAEFGSPPDGGTEVRMWFPDAKDEAARPLAHFNGPQDVEPKPAEPAEPMTIDSVPPAFDLWGDLRVTVSPVSLTSHVLGRVARTLAATSRFSLDRFSDLYLLADALGLHAQRTATSDRISFSLISAAKRLELTIGPFPAGSRRSLDSVLDLESPLEQLADEVRVDGDERSEMLHVVMRDRGARARHPHGH